MRVQAAILDEEERHQCDLVRDIFNPFHTTPFDPGWRTSVVAALANSVYDQRDFNTLPFLADALEEAGCIHETVLSHCRSPGPHVRGCWALDLILGK
jgi:hypothetical protein